MADTRWVVRHACAGHKQDWDGTDDDRPLDPAGVDQAAALAGVLAASSPRRLVSSPPRRCVDTLSPLAGSLGIAVEVDPLLRAADGAALVALLTTTTDTVLCTHGEVMEPAIPVLRSDGLVVVGGVGDDELLLKGAAWRLDRRTAGGWRLELVAPLPIPSCPHHR